MVSATTAPVTSGKTEATSSISKYAITNVAVVDVINGKVIPNQTVIIIGDQIAQIGAQGKIKLQPGMEAIDGNGYYLMPGLVDAHVHYFEADTFGRLMIANGVLLVRDVGMPTEYILKIRGELNRGELLGPEMVATGAILDGEPPLIPTISSSVKTPEEGRQAVRQLAATGVDMIKAYGRLDKDVFLAIIDEATKNHLKVAAHLPETIYIEDAAAAGLGSSEHFNGFEKVIAKLLGEPVNLTFYGLAADASYLQRLDEVNPQELQAVYQRIQASGMTICPTVVTFKTFVDNAKYQNGDFPNSEYVSATTREMWKSLWGSQSLDDYIWRNWARMVVDLNRAGVPLMIGTDLSLPGIIPGFSVHEEMTIWQDAGIPTADVLRSATIVPAEFMGLSDRLGSISEGKAASMVLLRANPFEDVRNTQQIEAVFMQGSYFSRAGLDQLLTEAKDLAQLPVP
jgi:imidazolonepropionase-like amidohydrolase